jgi:hypothetical protein
MRAQSQALIALKKLTPRMSSIPDGEPVFPLPDDLSAFKNDFVETIVRRIGNGGSVIVEYKTKREICLNVDFGQLRWWHCALTGKVNIGQVGEGGGVSFDCDQNVHALLFVLKLKGSWL